MKTFGSEAITKAAPDAAVGSARHDRGHRQGGRSFSPPMTPPITSPENVALLVDGGLWLKAEAREGGVDV